MPIVSVFSESIMNSRTNAWHNLPILWHYLLFLRSTSSFSVVTEFLLHSLQGNVVNLILAVDNILGTYDGKLAHAMQKLDIFVQYGKFNVRNKMLVAMERMPVPA